MKRRQFFRLAGYGLLAAVGLGSAPKMAPAQRPTPTPDALIEGEVAEVTIESTAGKTMKWRRYNALPQTVEPLTEGVPPVDEYITFVDTDDGYMIDAIQYGRMPEKVGVVANAQDRHRELNASIGEQLDALYKSAWEATLAR